MKLPKKTTVWKTIFPQGTFSKSSSKDIESKIGRLSFKPIDNTLEEINSGFVSIFDKDKSVEETGISLGSTYGLHLRTDIRKIDKKGAKVHLEKEIKASGRVWSRDEKRERLEQIHLKMLGQAIPIPTLQTIIIDHAKDIVYFQVNSEKQLEKILEIFSNAVGVPLKDIKSHYDADPEDVSLFMEYAWANDELSPRALSNGAIKLSGDDSVDLAFGRLNGKRCTSGVMVLPSSIAVQLYSSSISNLTIHLEKSEDPLEEGETDFLDFQIETIINAFIEVEKAFADFQKNDMKNAEKMLKEVFEQQVRDVVV